jgi:hypothetical protein
LKSPPADGIAVRFGGLDGSQDLFLGLDAF